MSSLAAALLAPVTVPASPCPADARAAAALLADQAKLHGLSDFKVRMGSYDKVSIPLFGGTTTSAMRANSKVAGEAERLWHMGLIMPGAVGDYRDAFLAAYPASKDFKSDCAKPDYCSWRPADMDRLDEKKIDKFLAPQSLYMAQLRAWPNEPGKILLSCVYRD